MTTVTRTLSITEKVAMILTRINRETPNAAPILVAQKLQEYMKVQGLYINEARGDLSGRW